MSILDSPEEIAAAEARLRDATRESLAQDLEFWTVASYDAAEDYRDLLERQRKTRVLHAEAEHWIGLIAHEIRRRRQSRKDVPS